MGFFSDIATGVKQKLGIQPQFKSPVPMSEDLRTYPGQANASWRQTVDRIDRPEVYGQPPRQKVKPVQQTKVQPKRQMVAGASTSKLAERIKQGIQRYNPNSPIASMSAELAEAGEGLPEPYLPALVAMIETSGGRNFTRGNNNLYNMLANETKYRPGGGLNYPDLKTAIVGGYNPEYKMVSKGFKGLLRGGMYDKYLKTGNLEDFLELFTPPADRNASMERQLYRYADLRKNFQ